MYICTYDVRSRVIQDGLSDDQAREVDLKPKWSEFWMKQRMPELIKLEEQKILDKLKKSEQSRNVSPPQRVQYHDSSEDRHEGGYRSRSRNRSSQGSLSRYSSRRSSSHHSSDHLSQRSRHSSSTTPFSPGRKNFERPNNGGSIDRKTNNYSPKTQHFNPTFGYRQWQKSSIWPNKKNTDREAQLELMDLLRLLSSLKEYLGGILGSKLSELLDKATTTDRFNHANGYMLDCTDLDLLETIKDKLRGLCSSRRFLRHIYYDIRRAIFSIEDFLQANQPPQSGIGKAGGNAVSSRDASIEMTASEEKIPDVDSITEGAENMAEPECETFTEDEIEEFLLNWTELSTEEIEFISKELNIQL